jgi:hypothetical protein
MRPVRQFTVVSNVPESLRAIESLATNLHWAWDRQLARLFDRLDGSPDGRSWRETGQHPVDLVRRTSPACWDTLAADEQFVEQKYAWSAIARTTSDLYGEVVAAGRHLTT